MEIKMARASHKPSCFISYCHEDTNKNAVIKLVEELKEISGTKINSTAKPPASPGRMAKAML
jgi:hypothetical protein